MVFTRAVASEEKMSDLNQRAGFHLRQYARMRQESSGKWTNEEQAIIELAIELENTRDTSHFVEQACTVIKDELENRPISGLEVRPLLMILEQALRYKFKPSGRPASSDE